MPAAIGLAIQAFISLMSAAPQIASIVQTAKDFFSTMFGAGVINKAQQDAIHAHLDSAWLLIQSGIILDHWKVDPDPS